MRDKADDMQGTQHDAGHFDIALEWRIMWQRVNGWFSACKSNFEGCVNERSIFPFCHPLYFCPFCQKWRMYTLILKEAARVFCGILETVFMTMRR